ncbi:MAG TPA: hypothetical protein VGE85_07350 [Terracidiphilus sp.]|jgi:hypothetical protein
MNYDDWKLETPEEEEYRLSNRLRRKKSRAEWMEEHADYLLEERREAESDHDRDWYQEHDPQSLVDSDNEHNRP